MTPQEMLIILGHRLEDPEGDLFTDKVKYLFLNRAQHKLMRLIHPHLRRGLFGGTQKDIALDIDLSMPTEFQYFLSLNATGDGGSLNPSPWGFEKGVLGLKKSGGSFIRKVSFDMVKDSVTGYTSFSTTEPVYFVWNQGLHIYMYTGKVDVFFIKNPIEIDDGVTIDVGGDWAGSWDLTFHDALVELAEAELWRTVNNEARMNMAEHNAGAMISLLNGIPATNVLGEGIPFDYSTSSNLVDPIYPPYSS
jgi:hypothetical protein|tara:strand:- start:7208 stop:7954 length:747 start_codon:yes stop_codon:yes gene_type:complete